MISGTLELYAGLWRAKVLRVESIYYGLRWGSSQNKGYIFKPKYIIAKLSPSSNSIWAVLVLNSADPSITVQQAGQNSTF